MEYVQKFLDVVSQAGPIQKLGDTLWRAADAVTTLLQRIVGDNLLPSLATMDPATLLVLGVVSFLVLFVIGYYALLTA
ncbi:MAG TPA: hypothetical protein VJT33_03360 [bacterium]|nr:hypothetical protein [bacterium]